MPVNQLPFIPYIHSGEDVIFAFYIFMRVSGLFVLSPLLGNPNIPKYVRMLLIAFITALLAMTLYPDYRGENPRYILSEFTKDQPLFLFTLFVTSIKEISIGYLIGFFFSLVIESLLFAAQSTSIMMGFSISRMLDPISGTTQTLLGQLYVLCGSLIIVTLDLHHIFIRITAESFSIIPLGNYQLPPETLDSLAKGSARMWFHALHLSAIPYTVIFLVTVGLGFMAKIMPEMNIFMVGFPLKIFIGYYCLIISINFFPPLIKQSFIEFANLARIILKHLGSA